ncbi:hypothetical protein R5W60_21670 (plasmid) [Brucella pseudintermedia]|uniref:hypothetical protein n=1 Tax=Brucella pseudintermedia TaxID=370111 RepID=UPI002AC93362|nr:hypothetical protein [Brucella pseudintermedia]WPM83106.1 hypothetical protein R5W60_21670 [Brucella pseudintermedia]
MTDRKFTYADFRKELVRVMPGYKWTVHRFKNQPNRLEATGTLSSGFNRLSTISVERIIDITGNPFYEVLYAGYGAKAGWYGSQIDKTLARAMRGLQDQFERKAHAYASYATTIESGRRLPEGGAK